MKLRYALWAVEPKYKKKPLYADLESDLDDDWIAEHEDQTLVKEIEKAEKKFAQDTEKRAEEDEKPFGDDVLKERLDEIRDEFKRLKKERGTTKHEPKRNRPAEKFVEAIDKLEEKIKATKLTAVDREEGKEISLGTR
jgi:DNA topoisomerase I